MTIVVEGNRRTARVVPVVVMRACFGTTILVDKGRVIGLDAGVDIGNDDALPLDIEVNPDLIGANFGDALFDSINRDIVNRDRLRDVKDLFGFDVGHVRTSGKIIQDIQTRSDRNGVDDVEGAVGRHIA